MYLYVHVCVLYTCMMVKIIGVNKRMKRIVIDGCMLWDHTPHNYMIGNRKKKVYVHRINET